MSGYYYLHENKDLIYKPHADACDLRDSDFVIAFWHFDGTDRATAWNILVEGLAAGADKNRVFELASKWGCSDYDARNYAAWCDCELGKDGNQFSAKKKDFVNLQESQCGFGDTALEAFSDLAKELGYKPRKTWGASFRDLVKVQS